MNIFITGLTGTLGTALAKLHHSRGDKVYGCARSEARAVAWLGEQRTLPATLLLGDAAQLAMPSTEMGRLLPSMDRVYHCAAMKHVDLCEQYPYEALLQNVDLTQTVAVACRQLKIGLVVVSSDKACLPQSVYGATKLLAEKIAVREGAAVVRLGNLIGSSGSVFQHWMGTIQGETRPLKITDGKMTRYFIGTKKAAEFIADGHIAGSVVIPDPLLAVHMGELCNDICRHFNHKPGVVGIGARAGECTHQWLVAPDEPFIQCSDKLILCGDGLAYHPGKCSATADRWKFKDILSELEQQL
jgi:FlaA1/EpsC-like NDP-sugar epimerase